MTNKTKTETITSASAALDEKTFDELLTKLGLTKDDAKGGVEVDLNLDTAEAKALLSSLITAIVGGPISDFKETFTASLPSDPERKTNSLTKERSERVDILTQALKSTLADQLIEHGPDRAAPKIAGTGIIQFVLAAERACFPGLTKEVIEGLRYAQSIGFVGKRG